MTQSNPQTTPEVNILSHEDGGSNWHESLSSDVASEPMIKKFKDVNALAKSYLNATKMIGTKLGIPSETAEDNVWNEFYSVLGRPERADDYNLQDVDVKDQFSKQARQWFYEAGLTQKQADRLSTAYRQYVENINTEQSAKQTEQESYDLEQLKREWGRGYDRNIALGQRALRHFAGNAKDIDGLEANLGTASVLKLFYRIGQAMTEDTFEGSTTFNGFNLNADQAKSEISKLMADKDFVTAFMNKNHPKHDEVLAKRSELFRIAYPSSE